jgi:hypothetical protein
VQCSTFSRFLAQALSKINTSKSICFKRKTILNGSLKTPSLLTIQGDDAETGLILTSLSKQLNINKGKVIPDDEFPTSLFK